ncbi:hypothetical protein BH20VER1_BH20VER1_24640 [soil metagenome]
MIGSDAEAWREQCRAQLQRDVLTRIKYGFCHVHKPVLDDEPVRAFRTMSEYRAWCEQNLPAYLGYRRAAG